MNIVLLGAPGAGKGTQAAKIIEAYGLPHISTGDILRAAVTNRSLLGLEAKRFMDAGELVPDSIVVGLVKERLSQPDTGKGFILDGFPRTKAQAEVLDSELASVGKTIDSAVAVIVDPEVIVGRLTARRSCRQCGRITSVSEGLSCTACGGALYQRDDDNEATVRNRLSVYEKSTAPLIDYYQAKGLLHEIDGDRPVDTVWADVRAALGA
ncbi:MAG: adenylate kinase [Actinobacteria bacterium HGW-Actinobacteria-7]|jgi:adenylate kinase|nr:MAG: adenylate kinase [Actinobacteria bacterium HGW-Actinobacteria-7]